MADRRKLRRCGGSQTRSTSKISDLPELVIQRIQSFLPHKQALCTCLISKSWLHAWCTFPILHFHLHHIQSTTIFVNFVHNTLKRYLSQNLVVEKLNLSVDCLIIDHLDDNIFFFLAQLDYHLNQWLQTSSQIIGLKELTLSLPHDLTHSLPHDDHDPLIKGISGKQTRLRGRRLLHVIPKKIVFHSLLVLELSNVHFDKQFHHLFSSSNFPIIEKLNILYCTGLERIKIVNFGCLVEFRFITNYQDVTTVVDIVHCPKLCSFQYVILKRFDMDLWDFKIDSYSYTNLRSLTFHNVRIDDDMLFKKILSKLPCLERLYLEEIWDTILVSSASLIELSLIDCKLKEVSLCDAPKLRLLTFKGDYLPFLSYDPYMEICKPLEVKLRSKGFFIPSLQRFFSVSHKIDIDIIQATHVHVPVHASLRLTTLHPSETTMEGSSILLTLTNSRSEESIMDALDAFFFVRYPKYVQLCSSSNKFFKFFIKKLRERKARHRCKVEARKGNKYYWRQYCLRELEIGFQKKNNKHYFFPWRNFLDDDDGYNNHLESAQMLRFRLKWS